MTVQTPPRLTRRALLGMLAGAAVACTPTRTTTAASPGPVALVSPSARSEAAPERSTPPADGPFEPIDGETYPNAKRVAGRFVQALTTYEAGTSWQAVFTAAARRHDDAFKPQAAARRARSLFVRGASSRGEVVYPQLGGLSIGAGLERCSVMVVVAQTLTDDRGESTVSRTVDVRLVNRDDEWRIEDLADAGGRPVERPDDLPPAAEAVLDDRRIGLPDSARWDIHAGRIDERLLRQMHEIAEQFPYSVTVLKRGHPYHVFGTDTVSGHTLGRGCDIWQVAGQPVVQHGGKASDARRFTELLLAAGVPELGSPWDLDGPPVPGQLRPSFTDAVHADHIHVAFKAP